MANITDLLRSSDPYDRQEGLRLLVESGNPKTLDVLKKFYRDDPDPDVRALAARYGKQLQSSGSANASSITPNKPKRKRKLTDVDPKVALERAMDYLIRNDYPTAWQYARDAFEADPSLVNDDYAVGLAADITGTSRENAVETLLSSPSSADDYEEDLGMKNGFVDSERVGWGRALLSVSAYAFISALISAIAVFLLANTFSDLFLAAAEADPTISSAELREFQSIVEGSGAFIAMMSVASFFSTFFSSAIGMMLGLALIHFVSVRMLGGRGFYTNLLYNTRIAYIITAIVGGLVGVYAVYLIFSAIPADPAVWEQIAASDDITALEPFFQNMGAAFGLMGLSALINIAILGWVCVIIGKTYDFGAGKGCLSIILSGVVLFAFSCACNVLISVLATSLSG